MLIDGEKWACEACVRGHRVSNCQHSDRPLQHINKKGRPVSQCGHCRSMRKSKSSHVKCDCGEKTHKCVHLQGVVEGHKESCCCNHGGRCTCSHKKDHPSLDPVPESDSDQEVSIATKSTSTKSAARRRRANTIHSDGMLSFDEHGHHKPTYKHTKVSQKCGPYQLNRVNSMHSASSLSNRSADNLLNGSSAGDSCCTGDSSLSGHAMQAKRRVKSEAASPMMTGHAAAFAHLNGQLPPLDLSSIEYPSYIAGGFDLFNNYSDHDQGLFSAGLSATSVDWSHYDLDFSANKSGDNFAPSIYSQPPSFAGFDFNGSEQAPTLTTTTSGEVSEVEDFLGPSLDDFDASGAFGANTATNGYLVAGPQHGLPLVNELGNLEYDELKLMKAGNKFLPTPASLSGDEPSLAITSAGASGFSFVEDDPALWVSDYSGLPSLNESPDPNMIPLWEQQ